MQSSHVYSKNIVSYTLVLRAVVYSDHCYNRTDRCILTVRDSVVQYRTSAAWLHTHNTVHCRTAQHYKAQSNKI